LERSLRGEKKNKGGSVIWLWKKSFSLFQDHFLVALATTGVLVTGEADALRQVGKLMVLPSRVECRVPEPVSQNTAKQGVFSGRSAGDRRMHRVLTAQSPDKRHHGARLVVLRQRRPAEQHRLLMKDLNKEAQALLICSVT